MRNFEELKMEIFERSNDLKIKKIKRQRKIITVCVALVLCVSIASTVLLPKLEIFNDNSVSGTKPNYIDVTDLTASKNGIVNLMAEVKPNKVTSLSSLDSQNVKSTDFAIRLFNASQKDGDNTLVSPLSVISALAMTVNGAEGETLKQMEAVLGMNREELNLYLYSYVNNLPQGDEYKLHLANSIWLSDSEDFKANPNFLQTNADFYGADIYKAPFNQKTCNDINNWVNENTDGMIPQIIDKLDENVVMCLVNALAFEAEWVSPYRKSAVQTGTFTSQSGAKQQVSFMTSVVHKYLEDQNATGFIKKYKDEKYAFVALLPKEGVRISEYMESLTGEHLNTLLKNPQDIKVYNRIPKFEVKYEVHMADILKSMGMPLAFDQKLANFKSLGNSAKGNVYIDDVIHKTFISVAEKGTKAGAATAVIMGGGSARPEPEEYKTVILDRPFLYMLIDCENNVPFFIGTMMDVNA